MHLGHQHVIKYLKEIALKSEGETVLFTFQPHPRMVLHPEDHGLELIQDIEERIRKLGEFGIDHLVLFPFTREFSRLSATEFVRDYLVNKIGVHTLTIGYNHHFGKNREGSLELLEELAPIYNFNVREIPAFRVNEMSISSTKVRKAISNGAILKANKYLGRPFNFHAKVVEGDRIGNTIGFPTANLIPIEELLVIPQSGVFAVKIKIEGIIYDGMMNIGVRPTINDSGIKKIEVNIFGFDQDIYNSQVEVFMIDEVRTEIQFNSLEELKNQLKKDENICKYILSHTDN